MKRMHNEIDKVLAVCVVWMACSLSAAVTIDPAKAEIISPDGATRLAADELRLHLEKITGVKVPVRGTATPGAYSFRFEKAVLGPNSEACEWEVGENVATFRGDVYLAVVDFLEDSLGVRWPGEDIIVAPTMNPLVVTETKGSFAPSLTIREIRHDAKFGNNEFARRMRAGRHNAPSYGHAFTGYWKRFGSTHPEYFALRPDGVRAPRGVTAEDMKENIAAVLRMNVWNLVGMCVASTGFQAQVIADWRKAGCPEYINLCENDIPGRESCQCEACKAHDAPIPPGADLNRATFYTDRYVWFGNEILKQARQYRPDVKVSYYAYNGTEDAPRRYRPDPDSVVGIVPTTFTYEAIDAYVGAWKAAGQKKFFYRPNRHYYYKMNDLPPGYEEHFFNVFQKLLKAGCIGFDYDAPGIGRQFMCWLDSYVLYHAMQDPTKPFAHWEDHYFSAFGAAAVDVKAYYRFWRNEVWNVRIEPNLAKLTVEGKWHNVARGIIWKLGEYYRTDDFDRSEHFLAAAAAKPLTPVRRKIVDKLRLCHEHGKIFVDAVVNKCEANTRKLAEFRDAHGFSRYVWAEQYYGDVTGIEAMFGPDVDPNRMKIVSPGAATKSAAEALQKALEKVTGFRPEVVPTPIAGSYNFVFKPMPTGRDDDFAWSISGEGTTFCGDSRAAVRDYLVKALGVTRDTDGRAVIKPRKPLSFDALSGSGKTGK